MLINRINSILPVTNKRDNNIIARNNSVLQCDTFEKSSSNVSFKGISLGEMLGSFLAHEKEERMLGTFLDAIEQYYFKSMKSRQKFGNLKNFSSSLPDYFKEITDQMPANESQDYLNTLNKYIIGSGINCFEYLNNYMRIYSSRNKKIFNGLNIEHIRIYSSLESKFDINKFPELLLHLYNQNALSENPQEFNPNPMLNFLKNSGVDEFSKFDEKFKHIARYFNDFQGIADKVDAINYLQKTYPIKLDYIEAAVNSSPYYNQSNSPARIYSKQNDIIDYLYEQNNGESLEPLSQVKDVFLLFDKIKNADIRPISKYFNNLETPEDKLSFMDLLVSGNISVNEYNKMSKTSIIEGNKLPDNILNTELITGKISTVSQIEESEAKNLYLQFNGLYNAVYNNNNEDNNRIKVITDVIGKFDLKASGSMLSLYNNINQTNNKTLTKDEFTKFIDLMDYCESKDVIRIAKKANVKPIDLIKNNKEQFMAVKQSIEDFLELDDTVTFSGKTPYEIYLQYKDVINNSPEKVTETLQNIVNLNIANSTDYKNKLAKVESLKIYFNDDTVFRKFIKDNELKFDSSEEDEKYLQTCIKTFSLLKEKAPDKLQYYTDTDFIAKSGLLLDDFYEEYNQENKQVKLLSIMADKKVPSIDSFKKYLNSYKDNKGRYGNLIAKLQALPQSIDFNKYIQGLDSIRKTLSFYEVPYGINNTNILNISDENILSANQYNSRNLYQLLNAMFNAKDSNFITKLQQATTDMRIKHPTFNIVNEFACLCDKTDESYKNSIEKMGLSKSKLGLSEYCNETTYIRAMCERIPQEYINMVNSFDWMQIFPDNKIPNLTMHAKMRLIDRLALDGNNTINDLNTEETKNKLKGILNAVYCENPYSITWKNGKMIVLTPYKSDIIKSVFSSDGKCITIAKKD